MEQLARPGTTLLTGEAHLLADQVEDARTCADRAVRLARQRGERGHEAWALRLFGEIAAHRTPLDADAAAAHYHQALTLAEELGMRPLQAHCRRGLGTLYARLGQWEQARPELGAALDFYRDMAMTFWLPQVEAALAQMG
jgi:tetratricopeptide (TPR) repeat protein